jgi:hypothetical protein
MPAMESLSTLIGICPDMVSKKTNRLLNTELFYQIYLALQSCLKKRYLPYLKLTKVSKELEKIMIDNKFMCEIVNDILATGTYTLEGIALYTQTTEDDIYEIASGINQNPSIFLSIKILELHREAQADLYKMMITDIIKKLQ